jgi:hypothetical protein
MSASACRSDSNRANTLGVHPPLDDLEGDSATNRLGLFRLVHLPHPALADLLQYAVVGDRLEILEQARRRGRLSLRLLLVELEQLRHLRP